MGEVMTQAIIGMPYDMAMSDELSRRQFHDRAQYLLGEHEKLQAENAKLRAELERRVPDGCLIVPIQPSEEMRKRAQDYLAAEGMIVSDWLIHTAYTEMLAAAPSAPKADDPVKQILLEALSKAVHRMEQMQDEIDGLINYAGGTGGFGEYEKHIEAARAAIAAARKGEGE